MIFNSKCIGYLGSTIKARPSVVFGLSEFKRSIASAKIQPVKLRYDKIDGSNTTIPPIIILHGLFGNKSNNRTLGRLLNKSLGCSVYLLDLRNHGQSPHATPHSYAAITEDLRTFFTDHNLKRDKPIIAGHSMGAKAAMCLCLESPELCSMLVSMDNAPVSTTPSGTFIRYLKALKTCTGRPEIATLRDADMVLSRIEPEKNVRAFLLTTLGRNKTNGGLEEKIPFDLLLDAIVHGEISSWPHAGTASGRKQWGGPSLFIRGKQSAYCADEYLPDIGMHFPRFEVADIDAGHWVSSEKPQECAEVITRFVSTYYDL